MKHVLLVLVLVCCCVGSAASQRVLLHDVFRGGVCADGFATDEKGYGNPARLELDVPPGAIIRKALLLAGEHQSMGNVQVQFDGQPIALGDVTRTVGPFASMYGPLAYLHVVDITDYFDPLVDVHTLRAPDQMYPSNRFNEFYIIVLYELSTMYEVEITICGNEHDFAETMRYAIPQHNTSLESAYGFAIMGGYICNPFSDGERIMVNDQHIGTLDTNDVKSGTCGGPVGSFRFEDNTLYGIGDDTPDTRMRRNDALANIAGYLTPGDDMIDLEFIHTQSASPIDNSVWAMVTVTGRCLPLNARADTTACLGMPFQLPLTRDTVGYSYRWTNLNTGEELIGNAPVVVPTEDTRYLARIAYGDGCTILDTLFVAVDVPRSIGAEFTQDRTMFDGESGEIGMVVRSVPPFVVSKEHRFTATIGIDRDLIELNTITTDKPNVAATVHDGTQGYEAELILPADYGIFDSIHLTLSGKSFLTVAPFDSARVTDVRFEGMPFCTDGLPSPTPMLVERGPECGDEPTRDMWVRKMNDISIQRKEHSIVIRSEVTGEYRITLYDMLGRQLEPDRVCELPVSIPLPLGISSPVLIYIRGEQSSYSRLFLP